MKLAAAFVTLALFAGQAGLPASAAAAPGKTAVVYDKAYIQHDETWSGEITLIGQNVVKRGCTLTILPGTVVKFPWVDEDKNGIGDGELTIEGRIIAKGTKDRPIVFTSAQPKPKIKDWTFVQIAMSKNSIVEYCKFEYAFTGLQVHYSTGTIKDNLFTNNFEGMRFSTTDVLIAHNDFINNNFGIRFEALGSRTTIRKNVFRGNGQTFFPVRKTWNSVKIYDNDILDSKEYAVNFGMNQKQDIDFTNNWWGTTDASAIEALIYDKSKDNTLGKADFIPFLKRPVKDCGIEQGGGRPE